jgi:hypothetical protein
MKQVLASVAVVGLLLWSGVEVSARSARATLRAGQQNVSRPGFGGAPAPAIPRNVGHGFYGTFTHPYYQHHKYYSHSYPYYRPPLIIVAPSYYYPYYHSYYSPASVYLSAPFYCFTHHEGFVSRIGFIDHVSGTHKIPINTVASICPDGNESCVIE